MRYLALPVLLVAAMLFSSPTFAAAPIPKQLATEVQNLVTLLSDGDAVGYPKATLIQKIKISSVKEITLTVFTVEGFGGGNNWSQCIAAFCHETSTKGKQHFMLIDVMHIGGGAWRSIETLNAKVAATGKKDETSIVIDTLENTDEDPPNFPSKKAALKLLLKNGRLSEQQSL